MKKIIALAVAGAFVSPVVFAEAEVGFSGEMEFQYVSSDGATADALNNFASEFNITATEELDNGMTIKATLQFSGDGTDAGNADTDGGTLGVSGAFGSISLGDNAGALDSIDSVTAIAPARDGSDLALGDDAGIAYVSPTVSGFTAMYSVSPSSSTTSTTADFSSYAVKYSMDGITVGVGKDELAAGDDTVVAVSYSFGDAYFAYGVGEDSSANDISSIAASYGMGALKLGVQKDETQDSTGATTADETHVFVQYNLGGAKLYLEQKSDDFADDTTIAGVEYKF